MVAASAGRKDLADDVTQEAFARLIIYHETVRDPLAWLFRTSFRLLSAELNRESRTGGEAPDRSLIATELSSELVAALSDLEPQVRLCVFLHYYADMSVAEVARLTGASVTATKVRLHRARKQLRASLAGAEVTHA